MTNGDRIRQMSNEELAKYISKNMSNCNCCAYDNSSKCFGSLCKDGIKAYLDMEVNND